MSKKVTHLVKQFAPDNYNLSIEISQDKLSFCGNVTIYGTRNSRPNSRLTFHQKGLEISNPKITYTAKNNTTKDIEISRIVHHSAYDEIRLHTKEQLQNGNYTISMDFKGKITENMDGIYPCFFTEDSKDKKLIATQFESHHAREAFPCIDEPLAKATFQLTLVTNDIDTVISNTKIIDEKITKNRKHTTFDITPRMSTYLLAFVAGELEYLEKKTKRGVTLRTYATKNQVKHSQFALDVGVKCLDFYEEYFDISYPLDKCDFIALPDFASGAMENWGCITYREQALLCDENTSLSSKQFVAIVVAHELTHQWFGNLVTMSWWTDLWLNEGFASWMEYLALDALFPEWKLWTQFAVDSHEAALRLDALEHTHPVEVPIRHPDEIRTIFDAISYEKGAAVIHMLHQYLGKDDFRSGIRHYLKKHAYKNTTTSDLWLAFEEVSSKPVSSFMSAWTKHAGFPLVHVSKSKDHYTLTQERFVLNSKSISRNDKTLWPIPLLQKSIELESFSKKTVHVPTAKRTIDKINVAQAGFYRVVYDESVREHIRSTIHDDTYSEIDRMGVLSDALEATKAGYESIDSFLYLLDSYKNDNSSIVWDIIASAFSSMKLVLDDKNDSLRDAIKHYIIAFTEQQYSRLGWSEIPNEAHLDTLLRPLIIALRAQSDDKETLNMISKLFKSCSSTTNTIDPNLRSAVYTTIARLGGKNEYNTLLQMYKNTHSSDEKLALTAGLTSFEQATIHSDVLSLIKEAKTIRNQDVAYWLAYSLSNRHSRIATWKWIQNNWNWLQKNLGTDLSFYRMPLYVARCFTNNKQLEEYTNFFNKHMSPVIERTYNQGLETIEWQIAWHERDSLRAIDWFKSH